MMTGEDLTRFLLVEDDDDHASLILHTLARHRLGNTVDRVADGVEAMAYLHRESPYQDKPRPGVILLDLSMPRMSGHEVLTRIKEDPELRPMRVVVLTTSEAESDRAKAYDQHADSYVVKPLNFPQFSKMIDELSLYWGVWNKPGP